MEKELSDPNEWVSLYGDALFKYTFIRLRDYELAEELVQETFLAALRGKEKFSGLSSEKTWLFGILKNKIADVYRKREKYKEHTISDDFLDEYFNAKGFWKKNTEHWNHDPKKLLEEKEFLQVFEHCMDDLSKDMGEPLRLKMLDEISSEEICNLLQITTTNLWVRLHRARTKLRECLDKCWFAKNS